LFGRPTLPTPSSLTLSAAMPSNADRRLQPLKPPAARSPDAAYVVVFSTLSIAFGEPPPLLKLLRGRICL
jgi:hypothetical protein